MSSTAPTPDKFAAQREDMVQHQLIRRGIRDERVLAAMRSVPRERFVPESRRAQAFEDHPLSIGHSQTISQPYIVALMLETLSLTGDERVLDVGTGSGYVTALLTELCRETYTIERIPELADAARHRLGEMGRAGVHYRVTDGTTGWPEEAPYDAIIVGAAAPAVPPTLREQLGDGGRLIIPVGDQVGQQLVLVERNGARFPEKNVCGCVFVKLIGEEGW